MRNNLFYACLITPLLLALSCSGYELCRYYWGQFGLTKECRDSFCCGSRTYGYCCHSCELRYPPVANCNQEEVFGNMFTLSGMQITWLVVGFILLIKGIIAIIYLCCCRKPNRRSTRGNTVVDTECGTSPTHIPYDPSGPGAPPSYEDLVKDGVLNHAYDQETCVTSDGAASRSEIGAPPVVPASGLPAPPPYSAVAPVVVAIPEVVPQVVSNVPQVLPDVPSTSSVAATAAPDNENQVPR